MEYKKKIEYAERIAVELDNDKSTSDITSELKAQGLYDRDVTSVLVSARKILGEKYEPKIEEFLLADKQVNGAPEFKSLDDETLTSITSKVVQKLAFAERKKITKLIKEGQSPDEVFNQVDTRFLPEHRAKEQIIKLQEVKHQNSGSGRMFNIFGGIGLILLTGVILVASGRLFHILPIIGLVMIAKGFMTDRIPKHLYRRNRNMSNLYAELATIYEAMYDTFIDYKKQYELYKGFLTKYDKKNVVEIACGTGKLSPYFAADQYPYQGLDLSLDMLNIARTRNPSTKYAQGDMRDFSLNEAVEAIIIPGRSVSYLIDNKDVESTIKSIYSNLKGGGIFCFDFIDAHKFFAEIGAEKTFVHEADNEGVTYQRKGTWRPNKLHGWSLYWDAIYYRKEGNKEIEVGKDSSMVRSFTKDEIVHFLNKYNFMVRDIFARDTYAFPTYVVAAQKD